MNKDNNKNDPFKYDVFFEALRQTYPICFWVNLSKDIYGDMTIKTSVMKEVSELAGFDEFMEKGGKNVPEDEREEFLSIFNRKALIDAYASGRRKIEHVHRMMAVDGEYHWMETSVIFMPDTGDGLMQITFARFVDDEMEVKLRNQKELLDAKERAEEANKAKNVFLANMSHDIRTPLNAIMGFTNIAIEQIDNKEEALKALKELRDSNMYMLSVVNDILDLTQFEVGTIRLNPNLVDLEACYNGLADSLTTMGKTNNRLIITKPLSITNKKVRLDQQRYNQLITNLVSNAFKYTKDGDTISISFDQLEIENPKYGIYRFVVEDTGIGMSDEFVQRIGTSFLRETASTINSTKGIGLGLTIVKNIVSLMGGTFEVSSKLGVGSKFSITVPMKIDESDASSDCKPYSGYDNVVKAGILEGKRILIVEDNAANRRILSSILKRNGMISERANDGLEAVNILRDKGVDYYDIILMDIMMPVMDGYEATVEIRKMYPNDHIPIIAVSANAYEEDRQKSLDAGMDDHLPKPIIDANLLKAMEKAYLEFKVQSR